MIRFIINCFRFVFSIKYEGKYIKIRILGICITIKSENIPIKYQIEKEFEEIKNENYYEKGKKVALLFSFGIGDYLLFRPFLPHIANHYKEYNITLIVNVYSGNYKDIIINFDMPYLTIDELIIFARHISNFERKVELFFCDKKYDIVISHFYGRNYALNYIMCKLNSNMKIGSYGSIWDETRSRRAFTSQYYDRIIYNNVDQDEAVHELDINKNFFEQLLNKKIEISTIDIKLEEEHFCGIDINSKCYCILFPFSSDKNRNYSMEYFLVIAQHLYSKYGIVSFVIGAGDNIKDCDEVINNKKYVKNMCGKYKLNEIFFLFNKAKLIITVDSAGYHIGVMTNKNIICLSCGQSYHRYLKYNDDYVKDKNINIVFPKQLQEDIKNNKAKLDFEYYPFYDINSIDPDYVCSVIDEKYDLFNT